LFCPFLCPSSFVCFFVLFEVRWHFHSMRSLRRLTALTQIGMGSCFYTNGRGDLCQREQRGGTMLNPPISVHCQSVLCSPYQSLERFKAVHFEV
jgi:hypothetical protein